MALDLKIAPSNEIWTRSCDQEAADEHDSRLDNQCINRRHWCIMFKKQHLIRYGPGRKCDRSLKQLLWALVVHGYLFYVSCKCAKVRKEQEVLPDYQEFHRPEPVL